MLPFSYLIHPQKMFMGRDFVVKHIRNKHGHVLDAERERLQEEAFWDNFRWAWLIAQPTDFGMAAVNWFVLGFRGRDPAPH